MRTVLLVATILLLGGCARPADLSADEAVVKQGDAGPRPTWSVGDWWEVRFFMDLGHHAARLRIFTALAAATDAAAFPILQAVTGLTAGSLGSHLKALEQVGYVGRGAASSISSRACVTV